MTSLRPSRWKAALALVLIGAAAVPAAAQPAETPPATEADKKAQAKAYVTAGLRAHDAGDYDAAIALYLQAYALVPHPALFFNIGQSHRLAGRDREALEMYQRYLVEVPVGALAEQTRIWIAALEQKAAEAAAAAEAAKRDDAGDSASPGAREPALDFRLRAGAPEAARDDDVPFWRYAGGVTAGAGAATALVGAYFGLRAMKQASEFSVSMAKFDTAKDERGKRDERRAFLLYGIGGALLAGGVATYFLAGHRDHDERPTTALAPSIGPDHIGLTWTGAF